MMQSTRSALTIFLRISPFPPALGGQGTVGQYHADSAVGGQMPDHVLEPGKVCIAGRRRAVLPAYIIQKFVLSPAGHIERRIGHDEIRLELGMTVVKEGVRIEFARSASIPRMARFICAIFQVVGLESCPKTEMRLMLPP